MVHTLFLIDLQNFSPSKISSYMVFVFFLFLKVASYVMKEKGEPDTEPEIIQVSRHVTAA